MLCMYFQGLLIGQGLIHRDQGSGDTNMDAWLAYNGSSFRWQACAGDGQALHVVPEMAMISIWWVSILTDSIVVLEFWH